MSRKCFSPLPSSFASIYLITSFFAISFISLFYLKYPQQYINHFDFRIVSVNSTTKTATTQLVVHDLVTPSTNVSKTAVKPVVIPTSLPDFPQPQPPVFHIQVVDPSVEQHLSPPIVNFPAVIPSIGQLSPPPVVNFPVDVTVNSPPRGNNDAEGENHGPTRPYDSQNSEETVHNNYLDSMKVSVPAVTLNQAKEKHDSKVNNNEVVDEDEDEDEDESSVMGYDRITFTPSYFTREERMGWIKQKIPESKILESTPRTRKFEFKMLQFVRAKRCRVNIFMTWISSTKYFGKREMFSLESITKAHPHACVIIISRIMATKTGRQIIQPLLDRGHMILTVAPDFPLLFQGTPAQDWFDRLKDGQVDPGMISLTQNLSNLLRLVVLYKYGGIYFDTDMIILKDVSHLKNSIGIQVLDPEKKTWLSVNNAVLIFDKGHPLLLRFLEEFNSNFDGNNWGHNGPYMTSRIIQEVLHDPKYSFNVMSPMAFYPIGWLEIQFIFRKPNDNDSDLDRDMFSKISKESYGVHLWQNLSRDLKIEKGSIVEKLLSKHCVLCQDIYDSW